MACAVLSAGIGWLQHNLGQSELTTLLQGNMAAVQMRILRSEYPEYLNEDTQRLLRY